MGKYLLKAMQNLKIPESNAKGRRATVNGLQIVFSPTMGNRALDQEEILR
jgi:hypothetical protein